MKQWLAPLLVIFFQFLFSVSHLKGEPADPQDSSPKRCGPPIEGLAVDFPSLNLAGLQSDQGQFELSLQRTGVRQTISGFLLVPSTMQSGRHTGHESTGSYRQNETSAENKMKKILREISAKAEMTEVAALDLYYLSEIAGLTGNPSRWNPTTYILFQFKMRKTDFDRLIKFKSPGHRNPLVHWYGSRDPRLSLPMDHSPILSRSRWKMEEARSLDFLKDPRMAKEIRRIFVLVRLPLISEVLDDQSSLLRQRVEELLSSGRLGSNEEGISISRSPVGIIEPGPKLANGRSYQVLEIGGSCELLLKLVEELGTELTSGKGPISWIGFMLHDIPAAWSPEFLP